MTALIMARSNSERVKNKLIRPFWGDISLIEIALKKFEALSIKTYVCADDFINEFAYIYGYDVIKRNKKSLDGESFLDVYNFLDKIEDDRMLIINPCFPLIKIQTVEKIIEDFNKNKYLSLITVKELKNIVYQDGKEINCGEIKGNTKFLNPLYENSAAIQIFRKKIAMNYGYPYRYTNEDPYLYLIKLLESTDINTEEDFKIAQVLYEKFS